MEQNIECYQTLENCSRINPVNAVVFYYTDENIDKPHLAISCKEDVMLFKKKSSFIDNKIPPIWDYMDIVKDEYKPDQKKINSIAFSKKKFENSSIMATASADNTVKLWEQKHNGLFGNILINTLTHTAPVNSVAFHPSGISKNSGKSTVLILASGCQDNTAKLWKLTVTSDIVFKCDATPIATLIGHTGSVNSVAFHPTDFIVATGSSDKKVKLWKFSLSDSKVDCVATLERHTDGVTSVAFNSNGTFLASGSYDKTVKLWSFSSNPLIENYVANLTGHTSAVSSVTFHPTKPFLATGSWDNTAKLWSISSIPSDNLIVNCVAKLIGHTDRVLSVSFHPIKDILVTGSEDKTAKLFYLPIQNNQSAGYKNNESRFFKLVSINGKEVDGGRYELPAKTKSGKPQTRGPKDKASTAFSEICKKNNKKGECSYKFAIQETTRGSNKKVYHYEGKRVKLAKPIVLELKDKKTGEVRKIVKKYKNVIVAI